MKLGKKFGAFLLSAALVFQTAGCGDAEQPQDNQVQAGGSQTASEKPGTDSGGNHILIAYFTAGENSDVDVVSSASVTTVNGEPKGRLRAVADMIQAETGGTLFSIQTSVEYPGDGGALIDYAAEEQDEDARPELTSHIEGLDDYDVIFVGYPTWWYDMPQALYSFFDEYDFSGKTIIPFNVHNGSRFSGTIETIQELEPDAEVITDGFTVSERDVAEAADDVAEWVNGLGYKNADNANAESAAMEENLMDGQTGAGRIPEELAQIPEDYFQPASEQGSVERLDYQTYESMSYEDRTTQLTKTAYVYLPYGYSAETPYNVLYLMHGGWSNETTYLGTPEDPHELKHVLDHAIQDKNMPPVIVVCPTYNNTSPEDSADYGLALRLTDNYHNELANDLIPAVEEKYSTYAEGTSAQELRESRSHRAFAGFSMGSVTTWHTFQYCMDYFRYFLPSSGNLTSDGAYMESLVTDAGYGPKDFFIYAMSGTEDFAYAAFTDQIQSMLDAQDGIFIDAVNEKDGNLAYRVQEGNAHDGNAALQYIYNGLIWLWAEEV